MAHRDKQTKKLRYIHAQIHSFSNRPKRSNRLIKILQENDQTIQFNNGLYQTKVITAKMYTHLFTHY